MGKFLFVGEEKYYVRGVTYGTFAENHETGDFPAPDIVAADFAEMARNGINTVRVYIVPPKWLLDAALEHRLRVLVGMPWEQHVAFLDDPETPDQIRDRLRAQLAHVVGHPAIFAYTVGNEIPASIVRWYGAPKVARFLAGLAALVREMEPGALVTYVNFPTTEYLELPFVDFMAFNVYLEDMESLSAYIARLQNLAGEKPLLMAEVGLDSRRNGLSMQARSLSRQIRTVGGAGAIGTFVFAWTDEWHRGGVQIEDWDFGLVTRGRAPKPSLSAVREAYADFPLKRRTWPKVSVVVCSYNGARTIGETLSALSRLDYPNAEVIVVSDGSTDGTDDVARNFNVKLISTENRGLSSARNTGLDASSGVYIAYIDDDAYPDPQWLKYLVLAFERHEFAAVGGPNIAPPEDSNFAQCVANSPGGPAHVLIDDEVAEHIPGCNMAFRADALRAIGGFDPQFRIAGDDVDVCWRIQEAGGLVGFSHSAVVWHHRRPSLRGYLKQQNGYARAEALVARKWPHKFSRSGQISWSGRMYGRGLLQSLATRQRIYHGTWGAAPFQSVYLSREGILTSLPLMPEWYSLVAILLSLGALSFDWPVLFGALILGLAGMAISVTMAVRGALRAQFPRVAPRTSGVFDLRLRGVVFVLHLLQPLVRLLGRIRYRLGPWSTSRVRLLPVPLSRRHELWTETWTSPHTTLEAICERLTEAGMPHAVGQSFDTWDIAAGFSVFSEVRSRMAVEEHGEGHQLFRLNFWPVVFTPTLALVGVLLSLATGAALSRAFLSAAVLALTAAGVATVAYSATTAAMASFDGAVRKVLAGISHQG